MHLSVSARKKYPSKLLASARAPRCLCKKKAPVQTPRLCASARNLVSSKLRAFASQRVHLGAFARNKITLCEKKNHPSKLRASAPLRENKHPPKLLGIARNILVILNLLPSIFPHFNSISSQVSTSWIKGCFYFHFIIRNLIYKVSNPSNEFTFCC